MTGAEIGVAIGAFFMSTTKFVFGPGILLVKDFGFWDTVYVSIAGGWTGTLFYYYGSSVFINMGAKRKARKEDEMKVNGTFVPKKVFSRKNRNIIFVKQRFGVWGIGLVTAPLISIPVGSILCAKFFRHHKSTIFVLLAYVVFYAFVITSVYWSFKPFFTDFFGD